MMLYDLLDVIDKGFHINIIGYDKSANISFRVWHGIRWQLIKEGVVENCAVRYLIQDTANGYLVIECELYYDAFKGGCLYGAQY